MEPEELKKKIEVILFASSEPQKISTLKHALDIEDENLIKEAIDQLQKDYLGEKGLFIENLQGGYQIFTRPEYDYLLGRLRQEERKYNISRAALEVLAIVTVFQPITKPEIESVRGISSDGVIKHLVDIELLRITGRLHTPGRPLLYATTPEFTKYFHISDKSELKNLYEKFSKDFEIKKEEAGENTFNEIEDNAEEHKE